MRPVLLIPFLTLALMGVDLPETGPLPAPDPREPATPAETSAPSPAPKPSDAISTSGQKPSESAEGAAKSSAASAKKLPSIEAPEIDPAALSACQTELRKLGVTFERVDPVVGENGCGIRAPFAVTEIANGVKLRPATQLRCATVIAMARWVDRIVVPATAALPGEVRLMRINHASTYVCRRRNNQPTGKMSEHSIGNAIDIVSFEFSGRDPITISPRDGKGTIEEAFQRAVRAGACLDFTTVLGPGADQSHNNHLHLDIAERRGGYRLCQ
ncbi:extensin family protein [uncultured Hoeflea sp.]|uniref:extensin-like domain-containing protein n=1 Tax=uncultured Hoeflea sp. TaxID=538666 RepID=UPI0026029BDF|nr:extensin family protein [uncultured Hoeflea sp.]